MESFYINILTLFITVGIILYFRRKDKRLTDANLFKNFVKQSTENLARIFDEKEKELRDKTINLDVSLKKLEKAGSFINKRMADFKGFIDQIEEKQNKLSSSLKEAQLFNDDLSEFREQVRVIEKSISDFKKISKDVSDLKQVQKEIEISVETGKTKSESTINSLIEKTKGVLSRFESEMNSEKEQKFAELEKKITDRLEDADYQMMKLEENINSVTKRQTEFDRESTARLEELQSASEEKYEEAFSTLSKAFADRVSEISSEMENQAKMLQKNSEERLSGVDEKLKSEMKKIQEKINSNIHTFNDKLIETGKSINEMNERLKTFVKENSERFRNEVAGLKNETINESNRFLEEISAREEKMHALAEEIQTRFSSAADVINATTSEETERVLSVLKEREKELTESVERHSGAVNDRLRQMESQLNSFENDLNKKTSEMGSGLERNISEYRESLENLQSMALNIEKEVEKTLQERTREMDLSLEKLRESYIDDYKSIIDNTKDEIIELNDEIKSLREKSLTEKDRILNAVKESVDGVKTWAVSQVETVRDEVESAKYRMESALVDAKDSLESSLNEFDSKLSRIRTQNTDELQTITKKSENLSDEMLSLEKKLENIHEELKNQSIKFFDSAQAEILAEVKSQMDDKMSDEIEVLERLFRDTRERTQSRFEEFKNQFEDPKDEILDSLRTESKKIHAEFEDWARQTVNEMGKLIRESDGDARDLRKQLKKVEGEMERALERLENSANRQIDGVIATLKAREEELEEELESFEARIIPPKDKIVSQMNEEAGEIMGDFKTRTEKISSDLQHALSGISERATELKESYNNTRADMEGRILQIKTRAESQLMELVDELNDFKKNIAQIEDESMESLESKAADFTAKLQAEYEQTEEDYENRLNGMKDEAMRLFESISGEMKNALQSVKESEKVLTSIEKQGKRADEVKQVMSDTLEMSREIEEKIDNLEKKRETVNSLMVSIDETADELAKLSGKIEESGNKIGMITKQSKRLEDEIREAKGNIESVFKQQDKMNLAVDKIGDIEGFLLHIEEEAKRIERMREWVARVQSDLENMKATLSETAPTDIVANANSGKNEEEIIKSVLRLKKQGWSIQEISSSLKIARTYVELILERYID